MKMMVSVVIVKRCANLKGEGMVEKGHVLLYEMICYTKYQLYKD
jgi:hypothetical protein